MTTIGSKIKNLRKSRKITQQEFADKIGVSRSTLSCYEIGQRTPSLKTLQQIADMFGVGLDYFGISDRERIGFVGIGNSFFDALNDIDHAAVRYKSNAGILSLYFLFEMIPCL